MVGCIRPDADGAGPDTGDPPPGGAMPPQTGLRAFRADLGVFRIAPIWIKNGEGGAPDTLTVAFGNGNFGTNSDAVLAADVHENKPTTDDFRTLAGGTASFRAGEFALLVHASGTALLDHGCTLFQLTGLLGDQLLHSSASPWNPAGDVVGLVPFTFPGG
jgi:hypothetical protein